jgi:hydrogenase 3 maturation protease
MDAMKTLKNSWNAPLRAFLKNSRKPAILGIGQELRGDDGAGIFLVRRLQKQTNAARPSAPFFFEAGSLPEASAGPLRRYGPDRVIFLDAADMEAAPGGIRWIDPAALESAPLATHTFPMGGFSEYLESELGCRVAILGIQPECIDFDAPVSDCVQRAINDIFDEIVSIIGGMNL